ncbi:MAG: glycosyltransferase family 2 protein [Anaerolineales bacterium]|nr:glycosyltransferase family 2 protein [Anaerolineales bacterium]
MSTCLYIVIVNWNLKEDTLACVHSLIKSGAETDHIIVVDNASTDGSVQALKKSFDSSLSIIEAGENLGFAAGNNLGIKKAIDAGAEWILLLNNDTVVAIDMLSEIKNAIQNNPDLAIVAPIIYYYDHPEIIWYLGDYLIPGTLITTNPHRGKKDSNNFPSIMPVDFVSGCGMMVKREVFEDIGYFDPSLFMYAEEVDFCWRARQAGYLLACATRAKVWHRISISAQKDQKSARYLRIRNQTRFYRKYSRGYQIPLMFIFSLSRSVFLVIRDILRRQAHLAPPSVRGWFEGWFKPDIFGTR